MELKFETQPPNCARVHYLPCEWINPEIKRPHSPLLPTLKEVSPQLPAVKAVLVSVLYKDHLALPLDC